MSERISYHGHIVQQFLGERNWELQSARLRIQELATVIKRQGSWTSFLSVVGRGSPPGLPAVHSRAMSVSDQWHEWHGTSCHELVHNEGGLKKLHDVSATCRSTARR